MKNKKHKPKKTYCFDIDGTVCSNTYGKYNLAKPNKHFIEIINALFQKGHKIIFYTSRGYTTGIDWAKTTKEQLKRWGVKYHQLIFGKPEADFYIDDRAIHSDDFLKGRSKVAKMNKDKNGDKI
jgi:hypothetical protein